MSDAYAKVDIPKSLPIHGMALTSTGRKIEHNKVVVDTQTYESNMARNQNQTQSEARELPTSGHNSVMKSPRILLIVFIGL